VVVVDVVAGAVAVVLCVVSVEVAAGVAAEL
jgi:hypothetical protein